jgi:hypothetical protein
MAKPLRVASSRTVPVPVERAFDVVMPEPLPALFSRRYGPIPPIREVREQPPTWDSVGQSRRIVLADGGTLKETLTSVDRPTSFGYDITDITGPMKPLAGRVEGLWTFESAGTGTRITWAWTIHPANAVSGLLLPVFGRFWRGYARQALEEVERVLVG